MTIYLVVPLLAVVAILQSTLVSHFRIWGIFADLPLLVVVSWGMLRGSREGLIWGFVAGLMLDIFSGAPFGAATFGLMAVGLLSGLGKSTVFQSRIVLPMLAVLLATVIYDIIFLIVVWISGYPVAWLDSLFRLVFPSAVLNTVLTPVIIVIMAWLNARFGREEMEW
ncbi:MAG: rod shape-determining protein MreD [Anaerolineae bacterium]|jgi:rod shape-determining protein MreD